MTRVRGVAPRRRVADIRVSRPVVIGRRGANALRATRHHVAADVEATLAAHEPTAEDEPRVLLDGDDVVGAWLGAVRAALRA